MDKLPDIFPFQRRLDELDAQMADPSFYNNPRKAAEVSREQQKTQQLVADYHAHEKAVKEIAEAQALIKDPAGDADLKELAGMELPELVKRREVSPQHFGEGITVFKSDLIELTWQTHVAFVYDRTSFEPKKQFSYPGEGWGLTHDGSSLIMSDGTDELRYLEPTTFVEKRRLKVTASGAPLRNLNELEYVKGEIFANVWQTDYVVRIDPASGKVTGYIDLRGLLSPAERSGTDVLNGIAYDEAHDRLFVTGKLWPKLFEIKLVKKSS